MSAQIIVLADRRPGRSSADPLELSAIAEADLMADPYGLVAAVRALASDMERMREQTAERRPAYPSPGDGARAAVGEAGTRAEAAEELGDLGPSFLCV